jgi:hypothetical protein
MLLSTQIVVSSLCRMPTTEMTSMFVVDIIDLQDVRSREGVRRHRQSIQASVSCVRASQGRGSADNVFREK